MGLTEFIVNLATNVIDKTSYLGVGFLMILESMVFPVPSEAVMPFAGFLWYEGKLSFWLIVLAATIGSLIGSLISYYVGAYGGRPLVKKFGKYLLLNEHHLEATERFFNRYGGKTIFFSRFIPVVRHLISLPAGVGRMNLTKFILYTVTGAALWNAFLTWLGYYLRSNWSEIKKYTSVIDYIIAAAILGVIIWFIYKQRKRRKENRGNS